MSSKADFAPIPAAAELALWHCAAFGYFSENVGVQPLPQTSRSLCELANMQTHTTDEPVAHTHSTLKRNHCRDSHVTASLLPPLSSFFFFFFLRRNRFPCFDLIPGSGIAALIRESDASGDAAREHDIQLKGLKTTSSKLDQCVDVES